MTNTNIDFDTIATKGFWEQALASDLVDASDIELIVKVAQQAVEEAKRRHREEVMGTVLELMAKNGISVDELTSATTKKPRKSASTGEKQVQKAHADVRYVDQAGEVKIATINTRGKLNRDIPEDCLTFLAKCKEDGYRRTATDVEKMTEADFVATFITVTE